MAHELTTGPEIIEAVLGTPSSPSKPSSGRVDVLVAGAGTGGTITGLSRAVKKSHNPYATIVGVDPVSNFIAFFPSSGPAADSFVRDRSEVSWLYPRP